MASGYSRSPKLLKGALIQFSAPMLVPIPNIIIFQYNPETMTRTLKPWSVARAEAAAADEAKQTALLAQPYDPQEAFSLTLEVDAADALEFPDSHPVAVVSGVADRVAAMEMLLYPPADSALGGLLNVSIDVSIGAGGISASASAGASAEAFKKAQRKQVPVVLFFWGPGRIVPVRLTSFQVEEQAFSPLLYPIRAKVTLGLTIVNPDDLKATKDDSADQVAVLEIAKACYTFTRVQKEVLATANLANSVESIVGMLPI
jgi:hypothetical protein